jgi:geranylgeranyl pyrophosphate synthase
VLLCAAIDLVAGVDGGRFVRLFVDKVRQTCAAEVEQELLLRGRKLDQASCLRLARGKTGALFSFIGCLCGDGEVKFSEAMEEACYRVGTAYQIVDDILDASGREQLAGKTLGTDAARQSFTVVNLSDGQGLAWRMVTEQLNSALNLLTQWSEAMESLASFIRQDLLPSLSEQGFVDTEKLELDLNPRRGKAREARHAV